jgi:hypothetical protein
MRPIFQIILEDFFSFRNQATQRTSPQVKRTCAGKKELQKNVMLLRREQKNKESDKIYRAKPENKERKREILREWLAKPENKERSRESQREWRAKPENKERNRERQREWLAKHENKERSRESLREWRAKPENLAKKKESDKIYRAKQENKERKRERQREWLAKLENKERNRESQREWVAKPENKERKRESQREWIEKPENKERKRESLREWFAKPVNKERKRESQREWFAKPENKERVLLKKRKSIAQKKKEMDPNYVYNPHKERIHNWKDKDSLISFFEKVGEKLKIVEEPDWYHVSNAQIRENGGAGLLVRYKSLGFALAFAYPDYPWDMEIFQYQCKLAAQREVRIKLEEIVPEGSVIFENFKKDPALYLLGSNHPSSYDFYMVLPGGRRLAIEYQGEQHYLDIRPENAPLSERQKRTLLSWNLLVSMELLSFIFLIGGIRSVIRFLQR